jgi:hypothetical protein
VGCVSLCFAGFTVFHPAQEQKAFLTTCTNCHRLERIVRSMHDADEFLQVFARMDGSTPLKPQRLVGDKRNDGAGQRQVHARHHHRI